MYENIVRKKRPGRPCLGNYVTEHYADVIDFLPASFYYNLINYFIWYEYYFRSENHSLSFSIYYNILVVLGVYDFLQINEKHIIIVGKWLFPQIYEVLY